MRAVSLAVMRRRLALLAGIALIAAGTAGAGDAKRPPAVTCQSDGMAGTAYVRGANCRQVLVDGYPRRYIVYVPTSPAIRLDRPLPVVFMFHGSSGSGEQFLKMSGWREQAERVGLIAIFPTGAVYRVLDSGRRNTKWNDYTLPREVSLTEKPAGYPSAAPWPANDVKFTSSMLDDVSAGVKVDAKRVYVSGFSNGGAFCMRLAVELSNRIAAAGCVGGGLDADRSKLVKRRIPVYALTGNADDKLAENIGVARLPLNAAELVAIPRLGARLALFVATFGLVNRYEETAGEGFVRLLYRTPQPGNRSGNTFRYQVLDGVTHQYPNGRNNPRGFVAARIFWDFFSRYPAR